MWRVTFCIPKIKQYPSIQYFSSEYRVRIAFACDPDAFAGDSATVRHAHLASILRNKRESQHSWEFNSFFPSDKVSQGQCWAYPSLFPPPSPRSKRPLSEESNIHTTPRGAEPGSQLDEACERPDRTRMQMTSQTAAMMPERAWWHRARGH